MLASLDQLEAFNNAEGRAAGDQLLRSFGQLVKQRSRSGDVAARYSGRAFALMLPSAPAEIALARAGELRVRAAELKARPEGAQPTISMAVGVAPADASSATALLTTLDEALAQAARQGGDRLIRAGENSS
jgi:diguanylate cyclase (GGDEF)-like protein